MENKGELGCFPYKIKWGDCHTFWTFFHINDAQEFVVVVVVVVVVFILPPTRNCNMGHTVMCTKQCKEKW